MNKIIPLALALGFALAAQAAPAPAPKKGYITDKLEVQMRAGQTLQHKVLKMIPSGTPVTIMGDNYDTGYSLVKLENGEDGWVLTRYLTTEPLIRSQLDEARRKLMAVQDDNRRLKEELVAVQSGKEGLDHVGRQHRAEIERLNTELIAIRQASANAVQIQDERDRLQQYVIELERDVETLRREKTALESDYRQGWFMIGAGVLFAGMLLGVVLPKLSWRKKASWDSF
ncbi:TIGR04211 family SH3 domain-containing protein [Methylomagnum ishizawai]|uniref:TIGR04211 family SH3 domain-containing protein n=1 Tax=Methylomagnum ishizawai TaxID=1760988 RepID=UPI001C330E83|nr:TIGR04211 family SH3 domain-containing protein [Methylomagnum ishizawai]BBL76338.1 hypothetical protein MishRS11D_34360 [Methylomagnum ishizawai]